MMNGMNLRKLSPIDYFMIFLVLGALIFLFNLFGAAYSQSETFRQIGPFIGALFVGYFWIKLAYSRPRSK